MLPTSKAFTASAVLLAISSFGCVAADNVCDIHSTEYDTFLCRRFCLDDLYYPSCGADENMMPVFSEEEGCYCAEFPKYDIALQTSSQVTMLRSSVAAGSTVLSELQLGSTSVSYSPDGTLLAVQLHDQVVVYESETLTPVSRHPDIKSHMNLSVGDVLWGIGDNDGCVVWMSVDGSHSDTQCAGFRNRIQELAPNPTEPDVFAYTYHRTDVSTSKFSLRIYNKGENREVELTGSAFNVRWSHDGKSLLYGNFVSDEYTSIELLDLQSNTSKVLHYGPDNSIGGFSPSWTSNRFCLSTVYESRFHLFMVPFVTTMDDPSITVADINKSIVACPDDNTIIAFTPNDWIGDNPSGPMSIIDINSGRTNLISEEVHQLQSFDLHPLN